VPVDLTARTYHDSSALRVHVKCQSFPNLDPNRYTRTVNAQTEGVRDAGTGEIFSLALVSSMEMNVLAADGRFEAYWF